ncbi:MAG: tetratricopeptide repeat protein [Acidobacteria bacterium]|nr:tetratricopeptide repeat protein [Acidobacteriota bacterium]
MSNGNGHLPIAALAEPAPLPETEIIPLAPAVNVIEFNPSLVEENQHATDALRLLREAKIIEARQEADAREYKQAYEQRLSQRLAHAPKPAPKPAEEAPEEKSSIPLITPKRIKNPLVPILPQQQIESSVGSSVEPSAKVTANIAVVIPPDMAAETMPEESPAIEIVRRYHGATLNPKNALQKVREQNRSALAVRAAASMLGLTLLVGGFYAYRHPVFSGNLMGGVRNLLSPEEQSAQLVQASRSDLEAGKVEEATQKLERAVALTPNEPLSHEQLAEAYEQRGRTDDALTTLDGLLRLAPEHLDARLKLAALQQRKGNVHEARAQFQKIIQLDQTSPQAAQALEAIETIDGALNAAALARNTNDVTRARRDLNIKRVGPTLPIITATRPVVPLTWRPPIATNSASDWAPRRTLEAPDPRTVATMHKETGLRYSNIREYNAALREFQEAARLTPNDKDLYYFLGSAYRGLGQSLKAFDHYKRCDSGPYAATAQSGATQIEKAARKEYDKLQQARLAPSTEANKNNSRNQGLENLSAPIVAPFGGRAAFNPTAKE